MTWAISILRVVPAWLWVVLAVLAWGGWQRHQARSAAEAAARSTQAAAVAAATAAAQAEAREREHATAAASRRATDAAHARAVAAARDAAGARAELERLRSILQPADTAGPGEPAEAASAPGRADAAASQRAVAAECPARLVEVAEAADTCAARLIGLQDWVRAVIPPETER